MNITLLAHCNVRSLLKLTTLSLFSDIQEDLDGMFEAVRTRLEGGQFPCVQNLCFEFHADLDHMNMETHVTNLLHRRLINEFSEICPSVINWYSTLGPVDRVCPNS